MNVSVTMLPWCITKLSGMRIYDKIGRMAVTLISSKMEEVGASAKALLEAALWMDL